ncbi:MAG: hypothetical protein GY941_15670 [Planctomycetes bacterium]|nr:hypothetical protein [Planctomycetota bacterium]
MYDINCPYCDHEHEICHDDGFGYKEGISHEDQCLNCEKYFTFSTSIVFYYEAFKADCLNGSGHTYKRSQTWPKKYTRMECISCDKVREPTEEEWKEIYKKEDTET